MAGAALRLLIALGAAFLLTSLGGAGVFGSPVTLPLLVWAARSAKTSAARAGITLVAVLTLAEVGWLAAYWMVGERLPAVLVIALAIVGAGGSVFVRLSWFAAAKRASA